MRLTWCQSHPPCNLRNESKIPFQKIVVRKPLRPLPNDLFEIQIARLAYLDPSLMGLTLAVSVVAALLASLYPTWRAAQVQPAWQLKSN